MAAFGILTQVLPLTFKYTSGLPVLLRAVFAKEDADPVPRPHP